MGKLDDLRRQENREIIDDFDHETEVDFLEEVDLLNIDDEMEVG